MAPLPRQRLPGQLKVAFGVMAVVAAGAYALLRTPEPAATALRLTAAVCSDTSSLSEMSSPEMSLSEVARRHLAESVAVSVDGEATSRESRGDLVGRVAALRLAHPRCSLVLRDWSLRSGDDGAGVDARVEAWVEGVVEFSSSQPGDLHAERRAVRALFRPAEDQPRLVRVELSRAERSLPEARP